MSNNGYWWMSDHFEYDGCSSWTNGDRTSNWSYGGQWYYDVYAYDSYGYRGETRVSIGDNRHRYIVKSNYLMDIYTSVSLGNHESILTTRK